MTPVHRPSGVTDSDSVFRAINPRMTSITAGSDPTHRAMIEPRMTSIMAHSDNRTNASDTKKVPGRHTQGAPDAGGNGNLTITNAARALAHPRRLALVATLSVHGTPGRDGRLELDRETLACQLVATDDMPGELPPVDLVDPETLTPDAIQYADVALDARHLRVLCGLDVIEADEETIRAGPRFNDAVAAFRALIDERERQMAAPGGEN